MGKLKGLVGGFKDPMRRPRFIIWTGGLVIAVALVAIVGIVATSTRWFCAAPCHIVQADAVKGHSISAHQQVSCMACHMPVSADPVTFLYHKIMAAKGVFSVLGKKWEVPLNPNSHAALKAEEFPDNKCTQCHKPTRDVIVSNGVIMDHEAHAKAKVRCVICHNRVAHPETFELVVRGPEGEKYEPHADFTEMTPCFRCHSLEEGAEAPGECSACHPKDFELKPSNHKVAGFYDPKGESKVHAEMAMEVIEGVEEAHKEAEEAAHGEAKAEPRMAKAYATEAEGEAEGREESETFEPELHLAEVDYCSTCHVKAEFCDGCHGMPIPHPEEFRDPAIIKTAADMKNGHPAVSKEQAKKCEMCHKSAETFFCDKCHHGEKSEGWKFNTKEAWVTQHADASRSKGIDSCLDCHEKKFCSDCHARRKPYPGSHKAGDWLRKPATAIGGHAESAKAATDSCEVCHGSGGANARFCKGCHKLEMPHEAKFTEFHAKTGRSKPGVCANCHTFRELCSDCHHEGAVNGKSWTNRVHGGVVNKTGGTGCFEKCHQKSMCNNCHSKRDPLPASHRRRDWTHRVKAKTAAKHTTVFEANAENCTYCHADGGTDAKFCKGCHKLAMPHPTDFKDAHKAQFEAKKISKASCSNCHKPRFCDDCHHPDASATKRWRTYHDDVVKKKGAEACFECHKETYCSHCHVKLLR